MGRDINIPWLVNNLLNVCKSYEGVTISGGEPFDQYESLIAFCASIKKYTNLSIYCFSGYTLDELSNNYKDGLFMKYLDFLMDGRYEEDKHEDNNMRGSYNQNLYQFIDGYPILKSCVKKPNRWSLAVTEENQIFISGIPKRGELSEIENKFNDIGIKLEFK
jgi:anaerobic ribonucleoside-triphosphate reductase activating protein